MLSALLFAAGCAVLALYLKSRQYVTPSLYMNLTQEGAPLLRPNPYEAISLAGVAILVAVAALTGVMATQRRTIPSKRILAIIACVALLGAAFLARERGEDRLIWEIENGSPASVADAFRATGHNVNDPLTIGPYRGMPPIVVASRRPEPHIVSALLRLGADPNATVAYSGRSALMYAAGYSRFVRVGCADNVLLLILSGADVDAVDVSGKTALDYAIENGTVSQLASLLLVRRGDRVSSDAAPSNDPTLLRQQIIRLFGEAGRPLDDSR